MALIELKNVTMSFEGVPAVENLSLKVEPGEMLVIVGENGSGKSTLIRLMLGLLKPQRGKVTYGKGLKRTQIGYLPQQRPSAKDFPASVEEIVRSGCIGRKDAAKRLAERVRRLNLSDMLKKPYRTLSGGQQQRVLLARALCATDSLIILDEPSAALDPDATADLYHLVDSLHRDDGVAVVMVSHDPANTLAFADKVLVMRRNAVFYGTPEDYKAFQGA